MPNTGVLSSISEHHYIRYHSENLVVLVWGRIHIQLPIEDLTILTHLIERWTPDTPNWFTPDGSYGMYLDSRGAIQLWMVDAGLRLQPDAFLLLSKLLCSAVCHLSQCSEVEGIGSPRYQTHQVFEQTLRAPEVWN